MKTRFVVEYKFSSLTLTVASAVLNAIPQYMKVDATCAKDAVQAVLAAHPNASITAVLEERPAQP